MKGAVVLVAAAVLVGGCSSTVEGRAVVADEAVGLFDPCNGISDSALRYVGVNPATEERGILGVQIPRFEICSWNGTGISLSVWSTDYSLDEVEANTNNADVRTASVHGGPAIKFGQRDDATGQICSVAWAASQGALIVRIVPDFGEAPIDPCGLASMITDKLFQELPR
ncbi:DUF3558 domain-containing protein [Rhodococcus sp. IEGM 1409]|uniref:DUF3558 domain-containing protein n=1 Tax=Rhodococcus sp. IEGM 1409 TaxID=3047082 RepID=UPI0024B7E36F|nr:DUF3558 domain-containing protein [Rhodococcus sp. IEGM 1409]MDI9903523.1 DUF3558 domain-containing protein [Rhodococcus sp. IEGM 1409]